MLTATHAFRLVEPYLLYKDTATRYFWQAVASAYIAIGLPKVDPVTNREIFDNTETPKWEEIIFKVRESTGSHDIKLVYSADQELKMYSNELYRYAAAKRTDLA